MFDQIKSLMEMQRKMQEVKAQLDAMTFEVKSPGGLVSITMNGSQVVQEVVVQEQADSVKLAAEFKDAVNRAIRRSQEIATQKMKDVTGLNLPAK